jgi:L-lactate dehydrogenase
MKVGIVGAGLVGSTAAYSLLLRGIGREIVLVDMNEARAKAEAEDIYHAVPFSSPLTVRSGDYEDLAGAKAVMIAAGVGQRPGETRMELLGRNAGVFRSVVPAVLKHAPDAIIVVASNPVDVMTHVAAHFGAEMGARPGQIFGTGTTLDTARFRTLIASRIEIDSQHVHAYVVGEHGDTEVLVWSSATVAGIPLEEFARTHGTTIGVRERAEIEDSVCQAAYRIIEGKGATYYGVGAAIARILDTVLSDRRSVLPVCAPADEIVGVKNVTVSLPRLVGGAGVLDTFDISMSELEAKALRASAEHVRGAIQEAETAIYEHARA